MVNPMPDVKKRFVTNETVWWTAMTVAVVAGVFCLTVTVLLIANYLQIRSVVPLDNPELLALRKQLAAAPKADEQLIEQIRVLDLLARKASFTSQAHLRLGGNLLLGGVIVLLVALRIAAKSRPRMPLPGVPTSEKRYWTTRARVRELTAFTGVVCLALALFAAYFARLDVPQPASEPAPATQEPAAASWPSWEAMQQNWPSFRGPGAYGVAHYTTAPTDWDGESGKNIRWKTEVPLTGPNSPVVWGNRVFLSGATKDTREVYCFDTETGALVWQKKLDPLPGTPGTPPKISDETSYCAPTMAVHGDRAFAIFANGDLACYDFDGNLVWGKNLGVPENHYGHASSLLAYQNLLFVQYDQKTNGKLYAFDIATGDEAWSVPRKKISWASPVCVPAPSGFQLVLNSELDVDAFDPLTGKVLWTVACLDGEVAPSPAYGGGMFFVANEYATSTAIRFNAETPEIAWQYDEYLPDVSSPVADGQRFYITTSMGDVVALDAATGTAAWEHEFDEGFYTSPILVGDRIYVTDRSGITQIFKAGPA
ncbi:MAG: outer membrane protein assembly factor BamB, partial [Candidatus Hydrogenedentes bacterium]|nr:outer membrane protein assembly factor BamB [Candidatus Hydrogenedentota bacterium]